MPEQNLVIKIMLHGIPETLVASIQSGIAAVIGETLGLEGVTHTTADTFSSTPKSRDAYLASIAAEKPDLKID